MEVPGPEIQSKPKLRPMPQLQRHHIPNLLCWPGIKTAPLQRGYWILNHTSAGSPWNSSELWFHLIKMFVHLIWFYFLNFRTTRSSNWNNNQTDYSSLSDSQFLFGSQFCPESSETLSTPLDFGVHLRHPKQSQQNSLDVSLIFRISLHVSQSLWR